MLASPLFTASLHGEKGSSSRAQFHMLARSFSFDFDSRQALERQTTRRTVPLTLFLQLFFVTSITVVIISISLVLLSFISESRDSVHSRLVQQHAHLTAQALSRRIHDAAGFHGSFATSLSFSPLGTAYNREILVPALDTLQSAAKQPQHLTLEEFALCAPEVGAARRRGEEGTLFAEPVGADSVTIRACFNGSCGLATVFRRAESEEMFPSLRRCLLQWDGDDETEGDGISLPVPASPLDDATRMTIKVTSREGNTSLSTLYSLRSWAFEHPDGYPLTTLLVATNAAPSAAAPQVLLASITDSTPAGLSAIRNALQHGHFTSVHEVDAAVVAHVESSELFAELQRGTRLMVLITVTIGVAVSVAGSLFVHVIIRPMVHLATDMSRVGKLEISQVADRSSIFKELDEVALLFSQVTAKVKVLRELLPASDDESDAAEGCDGAPLGATVDLSATASGAGAGDLTLAEAFVVHTVRVHVSYESRSSAKEVAAADFDFVYTEAEHELYERLCRECKEAVSESEFQQVQMIHVSEANEHTVLHTSLYLQELLSTNPAQLRLIMHKASRPLLGPLMTGAADMFNFIATMAFVGRLLHVGIERAAAIPFVCIYVFTLAMNSMLAVALLRTGNERFMRWVAQAGTETVIALVLSTLSSQNLQLLFSNIKVGIVGINFNAPRDDVLLQKSLSWSLFGFLFSDVMQLLFKIWVVYNSPSVDPLYVLALVSSGASVAFNLIFKTHAMLLWHNSSIVKGDGADGLAEEGHLVMKDVTLVLAHFVVPHYVRQLSLRAVELNAFYSAALPLARSHRGTPLLVHGGLVLVAFNANVQCSTHVNDALFFGLRLREVLDQKGQHAEIVATTGHYPLGMLGSLNSKALQCIGPLRAMCSLARTAHIAQQGFVVSGDFLVALGLSADALQPARLRRIQVRETGRMAASRNQVLLAACRPRQLFSHHASLRQEHSLLLAVFLSRAGDGMPPDIGAAQLAAACGLLTLDRDEMEQRVQQLTAAFLAWRESHSASSGCERALTADLVLGRIRTRPAVIAPSSQRLYNAEN